MAIYEIGTDGIVPFEQTSFEAAGVRERTDLQRLLKDRIDVVCPDVVVLSEGFRDWEDSRRELDLLAIDQNGNLVVIELKRTADAGHAELQAIRYAAMVSAMTFEKAVEVFGDHLRKSGPAANPTEELLQFLGWVEPDEDSFAQDVRIVLVAADFSRELTTSVMWLNERNLDIRCVRMPPYRDGQRLFVDVQQILPLPEATDYMIRIREKAAKERQDRVEHGGRKALRQAFWQSLLERSQGRLDLFANISPSQDSWISAGSGISGSHYVYVVTRDRASVRFVLEADSAADNKARFDWLHQRKDQIHEAVKEPLTWERCEELQHSRLSIGIEGGYRDDRDTWPKTQERMITAMKHLHEGIAPLIPQLRRGSR